MLSVNISVSIFRLKVEDAHTQFSKIWIYSQAHIYNWRRKRIHFPERCLLFGTSDFGQSLRNPVYAKFRIWPTRPNPSDADKWEHGLFLHLIALLFD
jgi:hypothetical protein